MQDIQSTKDVNGLSEKKGHNHKKDGEIQISFSTDSATDEEDTFRLKKFTRETILIDCCSQGTMLCQSLLKPDSN